ncbi:MAG: hypothetical protein IGQ88_10315 [Gloeomargaritaceae cyanobacterium C42_A2020_066]|nr:hypothetical protein [Gloeomargaritaceae cyanobacterium C42_A2020_066]
MGFVKTIFGGIFGFLGALLGLFLAVPRAILGLFSRKGEAPVAKAPPVSKKESSTFYLAPEDASSLGRRDETGQTAPAPVAAATPAPTPTASVPKSQMAFSSGSPDLSNRRRPGANMTGFMDMARQIRRG